MTILDPNFRSNAPRYMVQSVCAAGTILAISVFLNIRDLVIVASLGSTAFVIFSTPTRYTASPRCILGGHFIGLACGEIFEFIGNHIVVPGLVIPAFAVGMAFFVMVITNTDHPPAAGTALSFSLTDATVQTASSLMMGALVLALIGSFGRNRLRDLR